MKSYTTKERNTAALILSMCASNTNDQDYAFDSRDAADALDVKSKRARRLASDALGCTPMEDENSDSIAWAEQCAEAESWVRSGWSEPGDQTDFKMKREKPDPTVEQLLKTFGDDVTSIEVTRTVVDDRFDDEDADDYS